MGANTYYHSDTCNLPDLMELFNGKPHLGGTVEGKKMGEGEGES